MANKKPLKLSETHACAQQFESGDTIDAAFIENGVPTGGTAGQVLAKIDGTNYNTEWVDQTGGGGGASYLVYTALLTQSGTDAPVATVLENTLGGDVVWSYDSAGGYFGTLSGAFTASKTFLMINAANAVNGDFPDLASVVWWDTNSILVRSFPNGAFVNGQADNTLLEVSLEIRVYN